VPHLSELQKKFKDQGVVIIGISDEEAQKVKPFVEKMGDKMDYVVALDKDNGTFAAYMDAFGIDGIPHSFVVDTTGALVWHGHPMAGLDKTIEEVVTGKFDLEAAKKAAKAQAAVQEYFDLVVKGEKTARADELGSQIVSDAAKNAQLLNEFAWTILTEKRVKHRDLKLALRAAKLAYEGSEGKDASITDTYARALFDNGKVSEAIRYQKEAINGCQDERTKAELEKTLKAYQKKAKEDGV
jgi:hypothetical protein